MGTRKALGISAVSQVVTFVLGFVNVIVVSRLLAPEEIGIFSVSVAVLGLAHILRDFGVSNYLVQAAEVDKQKFRAAFTVAILSSWFVALILLLGRFPMARFYGHQGVAEVLLLVSLNFLILPLGAPAMAMLERDRQFGKHALMAIIGTFVQTIVTIGSAWLGESYLSMAWGSLAMTITRAIVVNFLRPGQMLILPTLQGLKQIAHFGSLNSLASIVRESGAAAPDLILGRTLGFTEVAIFSRGLGLYRMAMDRLISLVSGVYFVTFAADLRNGKDGAAMYCRATNYLLSLTAPTLAVLALLSKPLILILFGQQWERSIGVAVIICSASILTAPYALFSRSMVACGRLTMYLGAEVTVQAVRILVLLASMWWSLEQVMMLLVLVYVVEAIVAQYCLRRVFGLGSRVLLKQTWRALMLIPFAALGPAITTWHAWYFDWESRHVAVLTFAMPLSALGWVLGVFTLGHPMKAELIRLVRMVVQPSPQKS